MHRSGFVNIVGNPNVGKSTLMNALVGERLSIITSKAQTTRHRIMGIVNGEDFQMVYSDTPGVLSPNYRLQEQMLEFSRSALVDADVLLYVTEVQDNPDRNADFLAKVKKMAAAGTRVFLIINKIDLKNALPEGPAFFPKDQLTDKSERFFVNEIIREKILLNYDKEIPYSVEVEVESFIDHSEEKMTNDQLPMTNRNLVEISAVIYCERDSQKGIIIGKAGSALKRVGSQARKDIEEFLQKKVFLQLFVKVDRDWRSNTGRLKHYGYDLS